MSMAPAGQLIIRNNGFTRIWKWSLLGPSINKLSIRQSLAQGTVNHWVSRDQVIILVTIIQRLTMRRSANKMSLISLLFVLSLAQLSSSQAQQNSANIPFYSLIFSEKFPPTMGMFDCKFCYFDPDITLLFSSWFISRSSRYPDK